MPSWLREDVTIVGESLSKPPHDFHSVGQYGFWRWASSHRDEFQDMAWAGDEDDDDSEEQLMLYDYENALDGASGLADEHQERREYENERLEGSFANAFVARIENLKDLLAVRYPEVESTKAWAAGLVVVIAPVVQKYIVAAPQS